MYKEGKKSRILMLVPSMGSGGAERVMATLANELTIRDYEITILTFTTSESFYQLNSKVNIESFGLSINRKNKLTETIDMLFNGLKSIFLLKKYIKKYKPNIILSFLTHTNIIALIIRIFDKKVPLIISERADPQKRTYFLRLVTKYLYLNADLLVCQGEKVTKFFPEKSKEMIRVVPNPINKESISLKNILNRRKVIVGVGRLFPQKNFSLLIDCFNNLRDEYPEHMLEIYGEGYLKKQLHNKIHDLNLTHRVILKGRKKNVMQYAYDAELFVMSSDYEGFPNALIEAMASGLPVISTDFPTGIAQELISEENGLVVPVGDEIAMTNAIRKILSNTALIEKMSEKNREIITILSTENIVNSWIKLFDEVKERENNGKK